MANSNFGVRHEYSPERPSTHPDKFNIIRYPQEQDSPGGRSWTASQIGRTTDSTPHKVRHNVGGSLPSTDRGYFFESHEASTPSSHKLASLDHHDRFGEGNSGRVNSFPLTRQSQTDSRFASLDPTIQNDYHFSQHDKATPETEPLDGWVFPSHLQPHDPSFLPASVSPPVDDGIRANGKLHSDDHGVSRAEEGRVDSISYSVDSFGPKSTLESVHSVSTCKCDICRTQSVPEYRGRLRPIPLENCSHASFQNERYSLENLTTSDHYNEDRFFAVEGKGFKVFCVCDGHDGPSASDFASKYLEDNFSQKYWMSVVSKPVRNEGMMEEIMKVLFKDTEEKFFKSIAAVIQDKISLRKRIPQVRPNVILMM